MPKKPKYTGDGLRFHYAVANSGKTIAQLIETTELTMGTLYRLYKKVSFDDAEKTAAAGALERSVEDIFGMKSVPPERRRDEAFPLGPIGGDEATEKTRSGTEFIDLGSGRYAMIMPLVHEYAYGGYLRGFSDPEYIESLPKHSIIVNERHKGKYQAFEQRGESMMDGGEHSISPTDKIVGREVPRHYWRDTLHIKRYNEFIIVSRSQGIIVKQIIAHDKDTGILTLQSYNPDKIEYPDFQMSLDDISEIYNVVSVTKSRR